MRGDQSQQDPLFTMLTPEQLVPARHPIRRIKPIVDAALAELSPTFDRMYAHGGRPSIPPERLLKGCLLIALYSIRSERQSTAACWGPGLRSRAFGPRSHQREAQARGVRARTATPGWISKGHRRSNRTHASTTDPEAMLAKKGRAPARLCFNGHVLMENRHGLVVDVELSPATGNAELEAGLAMIARMQEERPVAGERTLGADKGYDVHAFVEGCRQLGVLPHVAPDTGNRRQNIGAEITRHPGYEISQRKRKLVEEIYGWVKTVGGGRKLRYIGLPRNQLWAELTAATYNLIRIVNLEAAAA